MAQHDYSLANQSGASFRSDLNNALSAIVSQNSGTSEPSTMYAYQMWADTTNGVMKLRNSANNAWITLYQLDGEYSTIALENGTAAAPSIYFKDSGTDTGIFSGGTDQVCVSTGGVERGRFDSSGRFLVGTSSTLAGATDSLLQIRGNSSGAQFAGKVALATDVAAASIVSGTDLGAIYFGNVANGIGGLIECKGDAQWGTNDYPARLTFSTTPDGSSSPVERMRIAQDGFITTTVPAHNQGNLSINATSTSYISNQFNINNYTAAGTGFSFLQCWSGNFGSERFKIIGNGNAQNTNNSYGSLSDIKLKENIVDANSQWDDIKSLQVRNYNFKKDPTHRQIGVIAQEVESISPGLVYETQDRDKDGNDLGTTTKGVQYSVLYMKAVKALQEAMERIEQLEASNADLIARVSALESA